MLSHLWQSAVELYGNDASGFQCHSILGRIQLQRAEALLGAPPGDIRNMNVNSRHQKSSEAVNFILEKALSSLRKAESHIVPRGPGGPGGSEVRQEGERTLPTLLERAEFGVRERRFNVRYNLIQVLKGLSRFQEALESGLRYIATEPHGLDDGAMLDVCLDIVDLMIMLDREKGHDALQTARECLAVPGLSI